MRCRCVLGTESGSTLLDFDGSIRKAVNKYQKENPNASFEQCEDSCFKGLDGNINLSTVSPRHFEAMLTRTCQVLVEGKYADILVPDRHYIPIKKDFSNVDEVVNKIKDVKLCETIANTCYEEIVGTAKITYRDFIEQILNSGKSKIIYQPSDEKILLLFAKYELQPWRFNPFKYFMLKVKGFLKAKLVEFGLSKYFIRS
ncbi:MAG: glycosyltransferase family 1 protein [Saprospiraceae bacterium]|nr:glycosyltransferase family 1 protein [Saprospiraceae bacterium]